MPCTNNIEELEGYGFRVTWATVRAGWEGVGRMGQLVTAEEVRLFACWHIDSAAMEVLPDVADLCVQCNEDVIERRLCRLAPTIGSREIRTWRVLLLSRLMKKLPESPVDGLAELTSFWSAFDFPADMPHVIQGLDNEMSPYEYYTQDNYNALLDRHTAWLRSEIRELSAKSEGQ